MERQRPICSYVVLLEVAHVADDSDPHEHGSRSQEDAADVVAGDHLAEAGGHSQAGGAAAGLDELLAAGTLFWISILRMEPMMLMRSLTMMRMYQPLTNSSLSHQGASLPLLFLQCSLYSCSQHQERHLVAATDVLVCFFHSSPIIIIIIIIILHLSCKSPKLHLQTAGESR